MKFDKAKRFSLHSPYFAKMCEDLDRYITKAPELMEARHTDSSKISLTIEFSYRQALVKDGNAPGGEREALIPTATYKVGLSMQAKAEQRGTVIMPGHELIQDDTGDFFILSTEEASGQLSMFNDYDELPRDSSLSSNISSAEASSVDEDEFSEGWNKLMQSETDTAPAEECDEQTEVDDAGVPLDTDTQSESCEEAEGDTDED